MNARFLFTPLAVGAALLTAACGKKDAHAGHDHAAGAAHDPGDAVVEKARAPEVAFKAGVGVTVPPEIRAVLGLATAAAEERVVARTLRVSAQVFKAGPPALANVTLPAAAAAGLAAPPLAGARLVSRTPQGGAPDSAVDLVFALEDPTRAAAKPGDFLDLTLALVDAPPATAVPRSALLRCAAGTFVYVVNGAAFLRTAVVVGAESATHVVIADGLYAGDEVVTHPVEQLWLIELSLAEGGGHHHSH
jgi:hypothetical protein